MAAADWAILMAWFSGLDDETEMGVKHIVYGVMSQQIADALYTPASMQAAKAHHADRPTPIQQVFGFLGDPSLRPFRAEDAETPSLFPDADERWLILCEVCGYTAEYPPSFVGPLVCGHDSNRTVKEIRFIQKEE